MYFIIFCIISILVIAVLPVIHLYLHSRFPSGISVFMF